MGWLSWLDTGSKAADTGLDLIQGAKSGIDMLFFTDEEKSIASQKGFELQLEHMKLNMDENSERSKARRSIAKAIVYYTLSMITFIGGVYKFDPAWAKFLIELSMQMKLGTAFVAVVVFYFGYYGIQGAIKKLKKD